MMSFEEFRQQMDVCLGDAIQEAGAAKEMTLVLDRLKALYSRFDEQERAIADEVIGEWVLSNDESRRYVADALISTLRIVRALPALHILLSRLKQSGELGAPYEASKVGATIAELTTGA